MEDIADCRELLALLLRRSGCEVDEATAALPAVKQAHATRPDLIIMDLSLPGITGDEATVRLKNDPSTRDIPVIVYTALHPNSPLVKRAISAGAAEILYKPISLAVFQETVLRYLSGDSSDNNCVSANPRLSAVPDVA